ncbi:hypothetical protein Ahy_A08g039130 [Arachis hypogaea]|uniref:Uncharacterized protein n=1 Tax=Arachis hypogaea TaxID=3818 RepID=A0A445BVE2_ARAHY|nr:hypothetical protein Ahy_A08g039130 [Arachis hypogaea]
MERRERKICIKEKEGTHVADTILSNKESHKNSGLFYSMKNATFDIVCIEQPLESKMENRNQFQELSKAKYNCLLFDYMLQKLDMEEAKVSELCYSLYKVYGTTMAGLKDDFHGFVHGRLPYKLLKADPVLIGWLTK